MAFALGPRAGSAGYRLAVFDRTASTNAEAMAAARAGETRPTWFVTTEQTAGRGRRQRPWIAPWGNLASTVLEFVDAPPSDAATLGFVASLALADALESLPQVNRSGPPVVFRVKWPNDVMANGMKIAGILLEAEKVAAGRLAVAAGIGTNVVAAPAATPNPATCLAAVGYSATAETVFAPLSDAWAALFGVWRDGRGFGEIRQRWLARAIGLGKPVSVRNGSATLEGIFDTIDEQGCMIIRTSEGRLMPITAGDVHFGAAASSGAA